MKQLKSFTAKLLATAAIFTTLLSFSSPLGGDVVEIYLDHKLVVQQFLYRKEAPKSIQLDKSFANQQMEILYTHCGVAGKGRNITVKDSQNNALLEWHYPDAAGVNTKMSCKVNDLLSLQKNKSVKRVNLYYYSQELPAGYLVASILLAD